MPHFLRDNSLKPACLFGHIEVIRIKQRLRTCRKPEIELS
ncbi:hypothetical protein RD1_2349 [Roseobacter denitrificans OCh 114]|uniref:Uncharacterized protein n=1 Tax=Roseobacter denitrificans (strain ATCC 33942 / OCh 114) TaxID=375451 RepID=Q167B8_ROSDO|nr:hypothetical protein RD1_2349 [Roseobacter denitrificans OCh 114]